MDISVPLSRNHMHSTYHSVQQQTRIFASKGNDNIRVSVHTQFNRAVTRSMASAGWHKAIFAIDQRDKINGACSWQD
ncbi:MAG: hypothetical protein G5703_05715 [Serratia symbiotica]|nr:hypothetical protein [Serratia symbiotica]